MAGVTRTDKGNEVQMKKKKKKTRTRTRTRTRTSIKTMFGVRVFLVVLVL